MLKPLDPRTGRPLSPKEAEAQRTTDFARMVHDLEVREEQSFANRKARPPRDGLPGLR